MSRIRLSKIKNIRNFVGIKKKDGTIITSSKYIRSSALIEMSEKDLQVLYNQNNVTTVIDLRTYKEKDEKPDIIPEGIKYYHIPLLGESAFGITHEEENDSVIYKKENEDEKSSKRESGSSSKNEYGVNKNLDVEEKDFKIPDMEEMYRGLVSDEFSVNGLKKVFEVINQNREKGTILWHCTEGKDRCGVVSALFLASEGVGRDEIFADYKLTAKVSNKKARKYYWLIRIFKKDKNVAKAVSKAFMADEKYLAAAFDEIEKRYGSMDNFLSLLRKGDLDPKY